MKPAIEDEHFSIVGVRYKAQASPAWDLYQNLVSIHERRFRMGDDLQEWVLLGTILVWSPENEGFIVSPRSKRMALRGYASLVVDVDWENYTLSVVEGFSKASLNAPLLISYALRFGLDAVLHFHGQVPGLPILPYAPPGTVRDNIRDLPANLAKGFNIKGHGCIIPG